MTRRRVAITGLGAVTPIGANVDDFWSSLLAGRSGVGPITQFDTTDFKCKIAAELSGFDPSDHFDSKEVKRTERFAQIAMVAARQAYAQSGMAEADIDPFEVGCIVGVGIGGIAFTEASCFIARDRGPSRVSAFLIPRIIANLAPGHIAIDLGVKGPNMAVITACAAGTNAVGESTEMIRRGAATVMIAGGAEAAICPIAFAGFERSRAVCRDSNEEPQKASRPFDAGRSGFVMGEGAGALILEEMEFAKARGANILAEIVGYGLTSDAFHVTAPAPGGEGAARALKLAVANAGLEPSQIGYINAHGTSTYLNDKLETAAINATFGEHASKLAVSSNKSMIGHLLGAAGAVEAVATVKTLLDQHIPPTINYETPDEECDLDYVPNTSRKVEGLDYAVSNSSGFGGHNAALVFTRNIE